MSGNLITGLSAALLIFASCQTPEREKIDRKAVVQRHNIVNQSADTLASLTVGNGVFAYTVDVTGMQSFPVYYKKGVSLGTQSEWGWNTFDNDENYLRSEEHTSELQSRENLVCRLLLEKKYTNNLVI